MIRTVGIVAVTALSGLLWAQSAAAPFEVGKVIPKVTCRANEQQGYALYLPGSFTANRKWPIIYVFDPLGRGAVAVETIRAAAEQYGYIVVASNNSRNGPQGGSAEAAQAMWVDTQQRFPIDQVRRYFAGMSGGARVATSLGLSCYGCVAGVIANAAGFPSGVIPTKTMRFAYFAAVGDADMNYSEFVELRPRLDEAGARYLIRTFDGAHGWAPAEVWSEALNWMDIQAMAIGLASRDSARIQKTLNDELERARGWEAKHELLSALREYQAIARNFAGLADTSAAKNRAAELSKEKEVARQAKQEHEDILEQDRLTSEASRQMEAVGSQDLDGAAFMQLRNQIASLKGDAAHASKDRERVVRKRAFDALVIQAVESEQRRMEVKDYRSALQYLELAAAGFDNLGWIHYQRARAFAGLTDRKQMFAELKQSLAAGFHVSAALEAPEFTPYHGDQEFQALASQWNKAAGRQ
ncbi:MAG TPA: hypothetical protein VFI95_08260 [Terriglobales bacterium]|nr:hypothetical protein [Terriglobales bacterium]